MPSQVPRLSLGVAASFALWSGHAAAAPAPALDRPPDPEVAALRARGPAALEALLATFDHAAAADRPALAARIDAVAGQRYATTSRLYWYTELPQALEAAHRLHRPILALRMLGDLREDLSCANSRLFRATLYANTEVSAFLRAHFVLYWSSERPVPTVTIDFGDGRKLVRTTTGNSVHYVLDEDGHVLDVLPGLYAPAVFQHELAAAAALAGRVRGLRAPDRLRATAAYLTAALEHTARAWDTVASIRYTARDPFLHDGRSGRSAVAAAQVTTMSKRVMEVPDLRAIGLVQPGEVPDDAAAWSAIGQRIWGIGQPARSSARQATGRSQPPAPPRSPAQPAALAPSTSPPSAPVSPAVPGVPAPLVLDPASRALVAWLHDAGPAGQRATPAELARVIARLEQHIVADTAINEFTLRPAIRRQLLGHPDLDLATVNRWIYDVVFATPQSDPWLGLRPRTEFSGLPGDGVVEP